MRVSAKGQVTIPKAVRDRAGLAAGAEVEFGVEEDRVTIRRIDRKNRPGPSRGEKLVAALRGTKSANLGLSTDEIMNLLRGDD